MKYTVVLLYYHWLHHVLVFMQTLKRSVPYWILSDNYKPVHFNSKHVLYKHDSQQQPRQQKGQAISSGQTVQIKQRAKKHVLERKVSVTEIVLFTGIAWVKYFLSRKDDLQQHSCPWSALTFETLLLLGPLCPLLPGWHSLCLWVCLAKLVLCSTVQPEELSQGEKPQCNLEITFLTL